MRKPPLVGGGGQSSLFSFGGGCWLQFHFFLAWQDLARRRGLNRSRMVVSSALAAVLIPPLLVFGYVRLRIHLESRPGIPPTPPPPDLLSTISFWLSLAIGVALLWP